MSEPRYWKTEQENNFIDGLGSFKHSFYESTPRVKLLRQYYKAAKKRKHWGYIHKKTIMDRVASELGWKKARNAKKVLTKTGK